MVECEALLRWSGGRGLLGSTGRLALEALRSCGVDVVEAEM